MTKITMSQTVTQFGTTYTSGHSYTLRSKEAKQLVKASQASKLDTKRAK